MKKKQSCCHLEEEKYSRFFSLSIDLLCIANFDGYFQDVNPSWTKILGWSKQELIARTFIEFVHPQDQATTILHTQSLAQGEDTINFENRYLCRDGSYKWLSWNATVYLQEKLIYAVAHDITVQKENEIALQKTIKELESLKFALNAHSIVAITDVEGIITYVNDKFCEISQYAREELVGQDHRIINSGYHSKEFFRDMWRTIAQGKIWEGEMKNKSKDGTFYWVDTIIVPVLNSCGQPDQYIAIRSNITHRKVYESVLLERSRLSYLSAEVSLALSQSGTLTDILQNCVNTISQCLDVAFIGIWTFEKQTQQLQLQAGVNCTDVKCNILTDILDFPHHQIVAKDAISLINHNHQAIFNQEVIINNQDDWVSSTFSIFRLCAYPLIIEQQLIGIVALFSHEVLTEPTHNLLNWIGNNIAVAIDRIWAREELLSRREALLLRLASEIRSSLDLDTILETAVNEIRSLLDIDRCYFIWYLPYASTPSLTITHEARNPNLPTMFGSISLEKSDFLVNKLLRQELICIDDIHQDFLLDQDMQTLFKEFSITSQLLLPIKSNAEEFGAIVCSHCHGERTWNHSEIILLQAVTDQLAIAINQSQLYTQSLTATSTAEAQTKKLTETLNKLQQTQSQLVQHEKMSSLGQLVAGVAHEINNPVNFIHGNLSHAQEYFSDLLKLLNLYQKHYAHPHVEIEDFIQEIDLEFLTSDLNKLLSSMNVGTNRIREIVLSLRNFSRLDEAEKKFVDIHEGIENTLLLLHHRWKNSRNGLGISIVKDYGNLPLIDCYPGHLNQVFMNILNNAIDALEELANPRDKNRNSDQEHIVPTICITTAVLDSNFISIKIADNGVGINNQARSKLFNPFFTTKPVGKGIGLGLSVSYQIIVEKHEGILECFSEPGQGTEFWIRIPCKF